jgi:hypothetical protein
MLFFPTEKIKRRFDLLTWPLPPKLIPWLTTVAGVNIWVTTPIVNTRSPLKDFYAAIASCWKDDREITTTAFWDYKHRLIILPQKTLYTVCWENTILHEIGHAVDFLLWENEGRLSGHKDIIPLLKPKHPLNKYCKQKEKQNNDLTEQFACSFAAYFKEPDNSPVNNIDDLDKRFIDFMGQKIITPFL